MKKIVLVLFALFAIAVLLGCKPEVVTPPKPLEESKPEVAPEKEVEIEEIEVEEKEKAKPAEELPQEEEKVKEEPKEEVKPQPSEIDEEEVTEEDEEDVVEELPEVRELLRRADEKVTSYSYLYGGPETGGIFKNTYFIKGNKMVIKLYEEDYYVREDYYDTIYIDFVTKKAIGCCETRARCISANVDNTNKVFTLNLSEISIPKTPYQWLKEINRAKIIGRTETFEGRMVTPIQYTRPDGTVVSMRLDNTYGLPRQVVITLGEKQIAKYQFNDMVFNAYKDADFVPPCVKN